MYAPPHWDVDGSIRLYFGRDCTATEQAILESLVSYINEIEHLCDPTILAKAD